MKKHSKCCNSVAHKQEAGNYFCSHCISICDVKYDLKPIFSLVLMLLLVFVNISCYAPNLVSKKSVYTPNKTNLDAYYKTNPLIIEIIESNGNAKAISFKDAKGIMQITEICLNDYNKINNTNYTEDDLFITNINKTIANWYISKRIPQLLREHKIKTNVMNVLICYNGGINTCLEYQKTKHLNKETQDYINKYFQNI